MFNLNFGEMLLLGAIALIAIGPKQLPEVARTVGKLLNEIRRATGDITKTFVDAREQTNEIINSTVSEFNKAADHMNQQLIPPQGPIQTGHRDNPDFPAPPTLTEPHEEQLSLLDQPQSPHDKKES